MPGRDEMTDRRREPGRIVGSDEAIRERSFRQHPRMVRLHHHHRTARAGPFASRQWVKDAGHQGYAIGAVLHEYLESTPLVGGHIQAGDEDDGIAVTSRLQLEPSRYLTVDRIAQVGQE